jgi:hypothetical protein
MVNVFRPGVHPSHSITQHFNNPFDLTTLTLLTLTQHSNNPFDPTTSLCLRFQMGYISTSSLDDADLACTVVTRYFFEA